MTQRFRLYALWLVIAGAFTFCNKGGNTPSNPPAPARLRLITSTVDRVEGFSFTNTKLSPVLRFNFSEKVNKSTAPSAVSFTDALGIVVPVNIGWERSDSTLVLQLPNPLKGLSRYTATVTTTLKSAAGGSLFSEASISLVSGIDSASKFPAISDDALLTLVQQQTFKYFWDFAHPVSGLSRERNSSGDIVTTGGSGFGIMSMVAAVHRGFITRSQAVQRMQTIADFLKNKAQRFKGAYPHWLNGSTGVVVPFSANDNGADLVETSFLAMGIITARQYFSDAGTAETNLRSDINNILNGIEWNWFRKGGEQVLYWHWSPDKAWTMNHKIGGWNECLITYVMAASSKNFSIPDTVYHKGFARDGAFANGKTFFGTKLPLGEDYGGPLFFTHYSFLGINPNGLADKYANYWEQNVAHSKINYAYCVSNPKGIWGYSNKSWGLTASDIPSGYTASSPLNDVGVIAPTAAISSLPYTPQESMEAIRFFYYTLGDRLWKEYGFVDAFTLQDLWFASSFLAIDQAPQIVMIENYRSALLWNMFCSAPEIKASLKKLGFTAPYL